MTDAGAHPSNQLPDLQAPRRPTVHSTSGEAAQTPVAASGTANGRAPSRGRRGQGRGQLRPVVDTAAAAAERALADLRPLSADAASSQTHGRPSGRPPRPASRLQASAAPFVPDAPSDGTAQLQDNDGHDFGGRPRAQRREGRRPQGSDALPLGGALHNAQASATRALGAAVQQQQRGGAGSGSAGAAAAALARGRGRVRRVLWRQPTAPTTQLRLLMTLETNTVAPSAPTLSRCDAGSCACCLRFRPTALPVLSRTYR